MPEKHLNDLLRWSIENSTTGKSDTPAEPPNTELTSGVMDAIMGGPSDAELMKASMDIISSPPSANVTLADKLKAFDNFEQLIESLDNANNMENLGLWTPLLEQLKSPEPDLRRMAAWCIGTAVQNNERTQERLLAVGGIPPLVAIAVNGAQPEEVRKKAIYALSSVCRNYQPAMDLCAVEMTKAGLPTLPVDANEMEIVDKVMDELRAVKPTKAA